MGFLPAEARAQLAPVGRLIYDVRAESLWDRDTATLPRRLRARRAKYRDFARRCIAPRALAGDRGEVEPCGLFLEAAREGLQTEWLPPPFGTGDVASLLRVNALPTILKAEELAAACGGLGLVLLAHDLGTAPLILSGHLPSIAGWLRRIYAEIKRGEPAIVAFAITEPGAGSDVEETDGARTARIVTHARQVPGGWILNGRKCFISNGAVARWVTVFAALEGEGVDSWTCFLVDSRVRGFSVGRKEKKLGQRAADASELLLEDVWVPDDRRVGPVRSGWALCRNVLNFSRPGVAAIALGIARGALEHALAFCNSTRLGGRLLSSYEDVQMRLAEMTLKVQAARAFVWQSSRYPLPFQAAGAMTKVFCSDVAWEVSTQAMELLGDHGYLAGRNVEKAARDARLTQIYEGTNQVNRLAIIESQLGAEFASS